MTEMPEKIKKALEKLGLPHLEWEYYETEINGLLMRTAKRYSPAKDSFEYYTFPMFSGIDANVRLDWEISTEALEDVTDEDVQGHMNCLMYNQLMQDLFEVISAVAKDGKFDSYLTAAFEAN